MDEVAERRNLSLNTVYVIKEDVKNYPNKNELFRPSMDYPEYLFKGDISKEKNLVYDMVRNGFRMMKLDDSNFGTVKWNPLKEIIKPGDFVLLKPNLVLHENKSACGTDCLFTNPSIVGALVDYVCIALEGKGKIILGDAPLQECDFDVLIKSSGYQSLVEYYQKKGIDIDLVDFRNVKTYVKDGLHHLQTEKKNDGVIVRLNNNSVFANVSQERMQNLRITNYDPRILQQHHCNDLHEYNVSKYVLEADVIINIPKPKTHRKAGVTISLKNLVGINANKEFLPHHTLGSKEEGGDAYENKNQYLKLANEVLDVRNTLVHEKQMILAMQAEKLYEELFNKGREESKEKYWEGSWHGNDTIWRTILDLNRILFYADKEGKMKDYKQRKLFIVGDMIVSGEKEGPLEPTPTYPGVIVMGDDPLKFDRVVCSLMGFDYHDIPTLENEEMIYVTHSISTNEEVDIVSNDERWNHRKMEEIRENSSLEFQPTMGWISKLGNRYREKLYQKIKMKNTSVYVWGVGVNGIYAANELLCNGISIEAFCDNNSQMWEREIIKGVNCINPLDIKKDIPVVIAIRDQFVKEVSRQIEELEGTVAGIINRGQ